MDCGKRSWTFWIIGPCVQHEEKNQSEAADQRLDKVKDFFPYILSFNRLDKVTDFFPYILSFNRLF